METVMRVCTMETAVLSTPLLSESLTFALLGCSSEPSFEVASDALDDEFPKALLAKA